MLSYPSYVLAVHSSRAVMIEQLPMTEFLLADAVTWMTIKNGKTHSVRDHSKAKKFRSKEFKIVFRLSDLMFDGKHKM